MKLRGDVLTEISYNHKDYVQAEAGQKRFKISLNTVKKICGFYTFTSDYSYRDDNYLHNPVIKEKSPKGRYWGESLEDVELLHQGISFSNDFKYALRIYWGLKNGYDKLPSNTLWKMCRFLVFECQYGWDDKAELYNPRLSKEAKKEDLKTIENIIDPRTIKPKTDRWYCKKAAEWIETVKQAHNLYCGDYVPWDGVRGYSGKVYNSFADQINDDQKEIVTSLYYQIHDDLLEMYRAIDSGSPQNDCKEDQLYAYVITALKYKTVISYQSGYDLWCSGGVVSYQSFGSGWHWYVHYGEGMKAHKVYSV